MKTIIDPQAKYAVYGTGLDAAHDYKAGCKSVYYRKHQKYFCGVFLFEFSGLYGFNFAD